MTNRRSCGLRSTTVSLFILCLLGLNSITHTTSKFTFNINLKDRILIGPGKRPVAAISPQTVSVSTNGTTVEKNNTVNVVQQPILDVSRLNLASSEALKAIRSLSLSLFTDLCPQGMLPLAFLYSQYQNRLSLIVTSLWLALFGAISAFTMFSVASLSRTTGSSSLAEMSSKLIGVKWWPVLAESVVTGVCLSNCLFYLFAIGRIMSSLVDGMSIFGGNSFDMSDKRITVVFSTCLVMIVSLYTQHCQGVNGVEAERIFPPRDTSSTVVKSKKRLLSLQPALLSVIAAFSLLAFMLYRQVDGAYSSGSRLLDHLPYGMRPSFPNDIGEALIEMKSSIFWDIVSILPFLSALSISFVSHYSAIDYFRQFSYSAAVENESTTSSNKKDKQKAVIVSSLKVFATVTTAVMMVIAASFSLSMSLGYRIFGLSAQSLIINNFPASYCADSLAFAVRLLMMLSLAGFAYPSMFATLLTSVESLLAPLGEPTRITANNERNDTLTVWKYMKQRKNLMLLLHGLLSILVLGLGEKQISFILTTLGFGCTATLAFSLPAVLQLIHMYKQGRTGLRISRLDMVMNTVILVVGLTATIGGAYGLLSFV